MAIAKVILNGETLMDVTSDTAAVGNMLNGTTATKNDGTKITGNITNKSSSDLTASGSVVTAPAGYYATSATKSITAGSAFPPAVTITKAPTIGVNASGVVTASYNGSSSITPTVTSGYITQGTAGTISTTGTSTYQLTSQAAATYYPSTADQTIASQRWLVGNQTIKSVTTTNLTAENIAEGVVVKVGDSANASRITQITGTHSGAKTYTATITGTGASTRCYVQYPSSTGTKYYTSNDSFEVEAGETIYLYANGTRDGGRIYVNDVMVAYGDYNSISYDYEVPSHVNIEIELDYGIAGTIYLNEIVDEISITSNGNYDVSEYDWATVNVQGGFTADDVAMRTISGSISGSATTIRDCAFLRCVNLTTASFPSCTSIGSSAFYYCINLTTASFPSCTYIDNYAFTYCSSLTTASFPSCTYIGSYAFQYCSSLTTVSFSLCTSIGSSAFQYCSNLTTVSFPSCTYIGNSAFGYCSSLTTVNFPRCTSIGSYAFRSCDSLTTVNFPRCTTIGSYAFAYISRLTTVSFPLCISINGYAFVDCSGLTTVDFPLCRSIGVSAFLRCGNLTTASFPSCSIIGGSAFSSCYNLLSLYLLGSSVPSLVYSTTGGVYGSIFVLSSLYDSFITATNWSAFSDRIVSM